MLNMHLPTVVYALAQLCSAACIPFDQALRHIGETQCVILESRKQLGGEAASLPAMPKNFDVEQRGNFSPGQFRAAHNRTIRKKKGIPTVPAEFPQDVEN